MKQRIIETIRAVPVAGKTYEEYVEAVAEKLIDVGAIITTLDASKELHWCEKCGQPLSLLTGDTFYASLYEALQLIVHYNGHSEWLNELCKALEEKKAFEYYSNPLPTSEWHTEKHMIWMLLVGMFGDWGTSIRSGWIEQRDACIEFIESIMLEEEDEEQ